jgi:hypothetical protein
MMWLDAICWLLVALNVAVGNFIVAGFLAFSLVILPPSRW